MKSILLSCCVMLGAVLFAQEEEIKWLSFEDAVEANEKEPRKFIVDVYTNWCGWCKRMDVTTFSDPVIIKYINENFHAVKLNAERTDTVVLGQQVFVNKGGRKRSPHDLAVALLNGKMSYPTLVYLDENVDMLQPMAGYVDAKSIEPILKFFGEDAYKSMDWPSFEAGFVGEVGRSNADNANPQSK